MSGTPPRQLRIPMLAALAALATLAAAARADWPPSGLPVALGPTHQLSPIGITGRDGELHLFWTDLGPSSHALWTQHLTVKGTPASGWPAGGRGVVPSPALLA